MTDAKKGKSDVFSAIGAAAGLGNAVRFPVLVARYGGAFVGVYAACLLLFCHPLLTRELQTGRSHVKILPVIAVAATLNAAYTGVYYGGVMQGLGKAAACMAAGDVRLFAVSVIFAVVPWAAVWLLILGGGRALSISGKVSLACYAVAVLPLAIFGAAGGAFALEVSDFLSAEIWAQALCQAMLSLSLAQWVMPALAADMPENTDCARASLRIIGVNFAICLFSAAAALPLAGSRSDGAQLLYALAMRAYGGGRAGRALGCVSLLLFGVVAIQSAASLLYPVAARSARSGAGLCLLAGLLSPLFAHCRGLVAACDFMACAVVAPILATSECVLFARRGGGILSVYVCPAAFGLCAAFSLLQAGACGLSPLYVAGAAAIYCLSLFIWALTDRTLCVRIETWKTYRQCAMRLKKGVSGLMSRVRRRKLPPRRAK